MRGSLSLLVAALTSTPLLSLLTKSTRRFFSTGLHSNSWDLLMDTPIVVRGLADIVDRYDVFLLDQFGVLHDGKAPFPGALHALAMLLEEKKKTCVVVSNTSSRAETAIGRWNKMGFPSGISFVTSGELAWNYLNEHYRGKSCAWVTWKEHASDGFIDTLDIGRASAEEADFVLLHGTQTLVDSNTNSGSRINVYTTGVIDPSITALFTTAIERGIPAICANMDLQAVTNGKIAFMPGTLMNEYERMGGRVISFGKPMTNVFERAIAIGLEQSEELRGVKSSKRRVLHCGDSIHHDIAGAAGSGIDSLLVTSHGIHREELREEEAAAAAVAAAAVAVAVAVAEAEGGKGKAVDNESSCNGNDNSSKKKKYPLLMRVTDLCDAEKVKRPTYVIRQFAC